jgi:predicted nucleic acid-binding protein
METGPQADATDRNPTDAIMIELLLRFARLMEAQLIDLQQSVRVFVANMNAAIEKLDEKVTEEGTQAQRIYESIFSETAGEAQILNERAASRVDDIIAELLSQAGADSGISEDLKNSFTLDASKAATVAAQEARDDVWAKISKKLESITRLEERLRPHVFTLVQCLIFEDIQSQRLDHLLRSYKMLNDRVTRHIHMHSLPQGEASSFTKEFLKKVRDMYTMDEERHVFDSIFPNVGK